VSRGNNLEGFTGREPRGQSGNLQQHEAANKCSKHKHLALGNKFAEKEGFLFGRF
jgi:hypothetical protein